MPRWAWSAEPSWVERHLVVLYCAVLCCAMLCLRCYAILYHSTLCHATLYCDTQGYAIQSMLYSTVPCRNPQQVKQQGELLEAQQQALKKQGREIEEVRKLLSTLPITDNNYNPNHNKKNDINAKAPAKPAVQVPPLPPLSPRPEPASARGKKEEGPTPRIQPLMFPPR